jgi:hypothetical protein
MISNKRRLAIILVSVTAGSLISLWIVKKRVGTLSQGNYYQLILNFIFASAIVIGIGIFFQQMNKKNPPGNDNNN